MPAVTEPPPFVEVKIEPNNSEDQRIKAYTFELWWRYIVTHYVANNCPQQILILTSTSQQLKRKIKFTEVQYEKHNALILCGWKKCKCVSVCVCVVGVLWKWNFLVIIIIPSPGCTATLFFFFLLVPVSLLAFSALWGWFFLFVFVFF